MLLETRNVTLERSSVMLSFIFWTRVTTSQVFISCTHEIVHHRYFYRVWFPCFVFRFDLVWKKKFSWKMSGLRRFPANESLRRTGLHLSLSAKSSFYLAACRTASDPHESQNSGALKAHSRAMEGLRCSYGGKEVCRHYWTSSYHFDEEEISFLKKPRLWKSNTVLCSDQGWH